MKKTDISIVIPSTGHFENVTRLITSIFNQDFNDLNYEILLILNGLEQKSADLLVERISKNENLKLFFINNRNASTARNMGFKEAQSDYILFLDDDSELLNKNFIISYFRLLNAQPEVFALGGGYITSNSAKYFDKVYNYIQMNWFYSGKLNLKGDARYLLGGNFVVRKSLVDSDILFSDEIPYGGSESYFFSTAYAKNKKIKQVPIDLIHHTSETLFSIFKKTIKQGRGQAIVEKKLKEMNQVDILKKSNAVDSGYLSLDHEHSMPFIYKPFIFLYRYSFWFGYFNYNKQHIMFIKFLFNNMTKYLNGLRYKLIDKLKSN